MTKQNSLRKYHLGVLRRRYGDLDDWALMRKATVEVFSANDVADLYDRYADDERSLTTAASFIACAMQLDDEGQ